MKLGRKPHTAGAEIRYEVDYSNWLAEGDTLSQTCTVSNATPAVTDVTVNGLVIMTQHLYFFVRGGTVGEVFTVQVTVKDSRGETDIDTIEYFVIAP